MVPIVMTIAFVATRDHAIPRYRECYGNSAPRVHGVFPLDHVAFIVSGDVSGSLPAATYCDLAAIAQRNLLSETFRSSFGFVVY